MLASCVDWNDAASKGSLLALEPNALIKRLLDKFLIRQCFSQGTDLSSCTQSELNRVVVPFESTLTNDFGC